MVRLSIRTKMIIGFAAAIVVQATITGLVGVRLFYDRMISQSQSEVANALNSAREIYLNRLHEINDVVRLSAARTVVIDALSRHDRAALARTLEAIRRDEGLDVLTVTDAQGRVMCRARNPQQHGDDRSTDPLIRAVLTEQRPVRGTRIVPREQLRKESPELAERAFVAFVETPRAKPRPESAETAGMMLAAGAPVTAGDGALAGVLHGGVLLNRNYAIVDKIKETVFEARRYKGRDIGTATIFQGDLRVSTNVRNEDGSRAIGTRVSAEVNEAVLERGRKWFDEAFVVNDWYITAYEPIRDVRDRIVGILYVGILKRPFTDALWNTLSVFFGLALLGVALVIVIAVVLAERLTRPLRDMAQLAHQVAEGDYDVEIRVQSRDEIGALAASLNVMTRRLGEMVGELREWARTLEHKVEQRSQEIQAMQSRLMQSEKLASLGKLAAGVAHEINNPMTGILTNASLLLEDLPAEDPRRDDLQSIVNETMRCRQIVKGLLDFARQTQPEKRSVAPNDVVLNSLALLRNQASFSNIEVAEDLDPDLPEIAADPNQLQQVFVNILLNASEAMDETGRIEVRTRRADGAGQRIEIAISDTGPGIPPDALSRLFDPFYTTKATGTGLGLAVSYGIVESHGGTIRVQSQPGRGATFIISLPVAPDDNAPASGEESPP